MFYIMGTVAELCRVSPDHERDDASSIVQMMRGDSFRKLGGDGNDYESCLRVYVREFPFVELYAQHDIGLPADLCTIDEDPEILEL